MRLRPGRSQRHVSFLAWYTEPPRWRKRPRISPQYSLGSVLVSVLAVQFFLHFRLRSSYPYFLYKFDKWDPNTPLYIYRNILAPKESLLIYTTCHNSAPFSVHRCTIPAIGIECDNRTRRIDCNEAVPYLNWIIENYERPLAKKYIFAHGHDTSWHYQGDFFTALENLLNATYYRKLTYGGVFRGNYFTGPWGYSEESWARPLYKFVFANTSMPPEPVIEANQRPCCATFWLNSELIWNRKKSEYIQMRDRLRQWSERHAEAKPDPAWYCGRTMEYNWHIIFTKKAFIDACHLCQGG